MSAGREIIVDEDALQIVREGRLLIDLYDAWLFDEFKPYVDQRIIEIGCGLGNMVRHFLDRELIVGTDISGDCIREVRQIFAHCYNTEFYAMSITDDQILHLANKNLDTAISLNVFEHIKDDETAIQHVWQLLKPGGTFILIIPAHEVLYGTMDASIGHYRRYTKAALSQKMVGRGFRVLHQKYVNLLGAIGWWVNGRVLKRPTPPSRQLKFFNTLVPYLRAVESIFTPPFGISLLTIAKKLDDR